MTLVFNMQHRNTPTPSLYTERHVFRKVKFTFYLLSDLYNKCTGGCFHWLGKQVEVMLAFVAALLPSFPTTELAGYVIPIEGR